MALHARRENYIQQPAVPQQPERQPVRKKNIWITKGEKVLYLSFLAAFVLCAVLILQNQATIQAASQEIQTIENSIDEKMKQNTDLSVQVSELSRYERIWSKAKESGLKLNDQNVKVVPRQ
ncbi:cell division protein FtsL [Planomicrobium sp. YIM 101495]|uniref:cell division protein FtsL n=1 Tax=Planomicrobium sp. YIM 101495 TaxID=2665160 RepID=UPI0012B9C378|nr:cell division protein FtsL [Planomicrobium sp. YIM 101495]MTD30331.1 cell division protein FtsL [Planomicrobium sp. YIM 101495]